MAEPSFLPPEPPVREVPGGSLRPSVVIDLAAYPEVGRRRALNERLLEHLCAVDADKDGPRFDEEDLDLLLLAAGHRFGAEAALLRRQAVIALGGIDRDEARRQLHDLAARVVEHDSVRIAALGALPEALREELARELADDPSPVVSGTARRLLDGGREDRRPHPAQVPADHEQGAHDVCLCPCCQ